MKHYLQTHLTGKGTFRYSIFCLLFTVAMVYPGLVTADGPQDQGAYPIVGLSLLCLLLWVGNAWCLTIAPEIRAQYIGILVLGGSAGAMAILGLSVPLPFLQGNIYVLMFIPAPFLPLVMIFQKILRLILLEYDVITVLSFLLPVPILVIGAWYTRRCYCVGMARQAAGGSAEEGDL